MADDGKKKISVDTKIKLYGEFKGKKPPEWYKERPSFKKLNDEIPIKKSMMLDPRKWKKRDLENGVYAVARYDLQLFATVLAGFDKDLKKVAGSNVKTQKTLFELEKKIPALIKRTVKSIEDKVSLALEEVEADKGNNKKALASGKEAIKRFNGLNTSNMFNGPAGDVDKYLKALSDAVKKAGGDDASARSKAAKGIASVRKDFAGEGKQVSVVAKYFKANGKKMANDKESAQELRDVGKMIMDADNTLQSVSDGADTFDEFLEDLGKELDDTYDDHKELINLGKHAKDLARMCEKDMKDAVAVLKKISDGFDKAAKNLKKP